MKPWNFNPNITRTNDSNPRRAVEVYCSDCGVAWIKRASHLKSWAGRCRSCAQKISNNLPGRRKGGRKQNPNKIEKVKKGRPKGEAHYKWKFDRTTLVTARLQAYDSRYREWMKKVKNRDKWKCKINNSDCNGRLEAHHILPWAKSPELRYEVNNGITLCHYHHPRTRENEQKFAPTFQEMVLRPAYELAM